MNDSSLNPVLNSVTSVSDDLTEVQPPKIEKRPEISKKEDIPSNTEKLNKLAETKEVELEKLLEDDLYLKLMSHRKILLTYLLRNRIIQKTILVVLSLMMNCTKCRFKKCTFSDGHEMEPSEGMYLTEKSHNEAYPLPNIVGSSPVINTSSNDKLPLPIDEQHKEDENEVFIVLKLQARSKLTFLYPSLVL